MSRLSPPSPSQAKATRFPAGEIAGSSSNPGKLVIGTGLATAGAASFRFSPPQRAAPMTASARVASTTCRRRTRPARAVSERAEAGASAPTKAAGAAGSRRRPVHRRDEPVPAARQRLDIARDVGRIVERLAQAAHRRVQAGLEVDERIGAPEAIAQCLARDELARTLEQRLQNRDGLVGNLEAGGAVAQLPRAPVQRERAESNRPGGRSPSRAWPPSHRP